MALGTCNKIILTIGCALLLLCPIHTYKKLSDEQTDEDLIFDDEDTVLLRSKRSIDDSHSSSLQKRQSFGLPPPDDDGDYVEGSGFDADPPTLRTYRITFLRNVIYNSKFADLSSPDFQLEKSSIETNFKQLFNSLSGNVDVHVVRIGSGKNGLQQEVLMDLTHESDTYENEGASIQRVLEGALTSKYIQSVPRSLSFKEVGDRSASRCKSNEELCPDGKCVPRCDGIPQCASGADERNCQSTDSGKQSVIDEVYISGENTSVFDTSGDRCSWESNICDTDRCINNTKWCDGIKDCEDNADEANCPGPQCGPQQLECDHKCISSNQLCDGVQDCLDGRDETPKFCAAPVVECRTDQFRCTDGECIDSFRRCDYIQDCSQNEDEVNCMCAMPNYQCLSGQCIDASKHCDGVKDCDDGSDETVGCKDDYCEGSGQFVCDDGDTCLSDEKLCDGIRNCDDGTDEADCAITTQRPIVTTISTTSTISTILTTAGRICPPGQLKCTDGSCIPVDYKCDGKVDCPDRSDEENCTRCNSDQWKCLSGECIPLHYRCNLNFDCNDTSDESDCKTCRNDEWQCRDSSCVPKNQRCDNVYQCSDKSDEDDCPGCRPGEWQCRDGSCIASEARCNNRIDCSDSSDEASCPGFACKEDEFACLDDGTCIPAYLVCDDRPYCRDGSDEFNCQKCKPNELTCEDNGVCFDSKLRCDGQKYCYDGSDEWGCPPKMCNMQFEWQCDYGECIDLMLRCDEVISCPRDNSDERNCPTPSPASCILPEYFLCGNGICIKGAKRCDGINNCQDGSDERNCPSSTCRFDEFHCDDGRCLSIEKVCDMQRDCANGEDERSCSCDPDQFKCTNGFCIPASKRCNGVPDCSQDASDESNCPTARPASTLCANNDFQCTNGQCIPNRYTCDGFPDCNDGSDETKIACGARACTDSEFTCGDGSCIDSNWLCDGVSDCVDALDEANCDTKCGASEFACSNGVCISESLRCDSRYDCQDGSDEQNCVCSPSQFTCRNGECVSRDGVCNQKFDCRDRSDEENCDSRTAHKTKFITPPPPVFGVLDSSQCTSNQFQCENEQCIPVSERCDSYFDCSDLSDELDCPSGRCLPGQFKCDSGECIDGSLKCNNAYDCADATDELDCDVIGIDQQTISNCGSFEFECRTGECVSKAVVCDGRSDCLDRSDENNCGGAGSRKCVEYQEFTCDSGECVSDLARCDGRRDCQDGSDEKDCSDQFLQPCGDSEFQCGDGQCVSAFVRCDGRFDCLDSSDEANCPATPIRPTPTTAPSPRPCGPSEFPCRNGDCIHSFLRCDGNYDCRDGSDENNCPPTPRPVQPPTCSLNEFTCRDGSCIDSRKKCDRSFDCVDRSDEENCQDANYFLCYNGQKIPNRQKCDGRRNCQDGSDEAGCRLPPSPPTQDSINLKTYPDEQDIKQSREVVFQCRDEGRQRRPVRWVRAGGQRLPPGTTDVRGRLTMPNIQLEYSGTYYCEAQGVSSSTHGNRKPVTLHVIPFELSTPSPSRPVCSRNEATCRTGECIPKDAICDGDSDCSDGSDEARCDPLGCEPNEFQCDNKQCVGKAWICDGDNDCGDGSDETCAQKPKNGTCEHHEFACQTGGSQCVPKSFQCDNEVDCFDASDEFGCSKPIVIEPPPRIINVEMQATFTITCKAVGIPVPIVIWRLNWGHVPPTCTMTSEQGYGVLTCVSAQPHHQGAYSCEAINSLGSVFAEPDAIVTVKTTDSVCSPPKFNAAAIDEGDCLTCFCFGITDQCYSTERFISQLPPPTTDTFNIVGVNQDQFRGNYVIRDQEYSLSQRFLRPLFNRASVQLEVRDRNRLGGPSDLLIFFSLPDTHKGSQLTAYGSYLRYTINFKGSGVRQVIRGPDVILRGNNVTIIHVHDHTFESEQRNQIDVRFWPGSWYKKVLKRGGRIQSQEPASRRDILTVLENIDIFLIRASYVDGSYIDTTLSEVQLDTALFRQTNQGRAVYAEECRCPPGYTGVSCEKCASNYRRSFDGPYLGRCVLDVGCNPGEYGDPAKGIPCLPCPCPLTNQANRFSHSCYLDSDGQVTCNCERGYEGRRCETCAEGYEGNPTIPGESCQPAGECDINGSHRSEPDPITGLCECKEYTAGPKCSQCERGTFHLDLNNQYGCIKCFCMGITDICTSSNWYRSDEFINFVSNTQGMQLVDQYQRQVIRNNIFADTGRQELIYREFAELPPDVYYWKLPQKFVGDKIGAYGGNLTFTLRYAPAPGGQSSRNNAFDVKIFGNDINIRYYGRQKLSADSLETVSVPFYEQYWQKQGGQTVTREDFLNALADLEYILIKATYTTNTQEVGLKEVRMDVAVPRNTGRERAYAVEMCDCPEGYRGLSCEDCDIGFTRSLSGAFLGTCERCNCNGFSFECDPETAACINCRENRAGESCDRCADGYFMNVNGICERAEPCSCDPRGSDSTQCFDDRCQCKSNVEGDECNTCRQGHFFLSQNNKEGCMSCWCNGVTNQCSSLQYYREQIPMSLFPGHGFTLADRLRVTIISDGLEANVPENEITFTRFNELPPQTTFYWSLPRIFTGNRLTSYGSQLSVTQNFDSRSTSDIYADADVIITSGDKREFIWMNPNPLKPRGTQNYTVQLDESQFTVDQRPATRREFLAALANIEAILIRAQFSESMISTSLQYVTMDTAVDYQTGQSRAHEVEHCKCPKEYVGFSCEECAQGYYRDSRSNRCSRCPCNGKEESCYAERSGNVICKCLPGFSGPNCGISGILIELQPLDIYFDKDKDQVFRNLTCSYKSSEAMGDIAFYGDSSPIVSSSISGDKRAALSLEIRYSSAYTFSASVKISKGTKYVRCKVFDLEGVERADMASKVHYLENRLRYFARKSTMFGTHGYYTLNGLPLISGPSVSGTLEITISRPVYETEVGATIELTCRSSTGARVSFVWDKEGGTLPYGRASDNRQGTLVIAQARPEDAGIYICRGSTGVYVDEERTELIVTGGPPPSVPVVIIEERRKEVEISVGQVFEVRCRASGSPPPQVQWIRQDGRPLHSSVIQRNGILTFRNPQLSDSGSYICRGRNAGGVATATIVIYVGEDFRPTGRPPTDNFIIVQVSEEEVQAKPGEVVTITCIVPNTAFRATITWTREQGQLPQQASQRDSELIIPNAQPVDSGLYTCRVKDERGRTGAATTRVNILYYGNLPEVRVEPDRQTVHQGKSAQIRCIATGNPAPKITWTKINEEMGRSVIVNDGLLRIGNAAISDRGMYLCKAVNDVGTAQAAAILEVERREPPVVEMYPDSHQVIERGSSAMFQCHLTGGIPSPTVSWVRSDGRPLTPNTITLNGGVLKFNQVTGDEEGSYICTAVNDAGRMTATATLEIQAIPVITLTPSISVVRVRLGEPIRLECSSEGDPPPAVKWQKLQLNVETDIQSVSRTFSSSVYEVSRASMADQGTYQCTATNAVGTIVERIQVLVQDSLPVFPPPVIGPRPKPRPRPVPRPQPVPRPGSESYQVPLGGNFEFRCYAENNGEPKEDLIYTFIRSDGRPLPRGHVESNGILSVSNIDINAGGEYACIVKERITERVLITIYASLEVVEHPRVRLEPARQVVRPGDTVSLRCIVTGAHPITINWSKERGPMPPSVIINGGELLFRGIATTDAGRYICEAVNSVGRATSIAEVVVNERPLLTALQDSVSVSQGQDINLRCETSGVNPASVQWTLDGRSLPRNTYVLPFDAVLRISNAQPDNAGRYKCEASTSLGVSTYDFINLRVQSSRLVDVRIRSSSNNLRLGDPVELFCDVVGQDRPVISWSRQGAPLPYNARAEGRALRIANVQPNNGGIYTCTVTTSRGVFEESYPLTIQNIPSYGPGARSVKTRSTKFGSQVDLTCGVELDPPVTFTWAKLGDKLPIRARLKEDVIEIPDAQADDAGTYICTAQNHQKSIDTPILLVVTGVVPRFSGNSYLALPTLPDAYLVFDLEISFKPEAHDGLILYNSQRDGPGDFISFGLSDGYPEFRFDVGSGPAILRSGQRLPLNEWHTVKLSRNRKEGTMIVNKGTPIMGKSEGRFQGLDLINPLYFGGVPDMSKINDEAGFVSGFQGCISRLVIGLTIPELLRDARSQRDVEPCDTCSTNPCENGGVCQESYSPKGHKCICSAGFSGEMCESTGESCYPGVCGTGRCVNIPDAIECLCPFGTTGPRCDQSITITEPSFAWGAYMAYPTPRALKRFSVAMKVKPENDEDGILMYSGQQERGDGDFASLALRDKRFEFKFNTGTGTATLTSDVLVTPGEWIKVHANRTNKMGSLRVNDGPLQHAQSPGSSRSLNLRTYLYIGGVDKSKISVAPDMGVLQGFTGCITDIEIMDQPINVADSLVDSSNVDECGVTPCSRNPCLNGGVCADDVSAHLGFVCSCPAEFYGPRCRSRHQEICVNGKVCGNEGVCKGVSNSSSAIKECFCPLGFAGPNCEHETFLGESTSYNGYSWAEMDRYLLPQDGISDQTVTLDFSTIDNEGVILWLGQPPTEDGADKDYLSVGIVDGFVDFTFQMDGEVMVARSQQRVNDGVLHSISAERRTNVGTLMVDGLPPVVAEGSRSLFSFNTLGNIYIGGTPNLTRMTGNKYRTGFKGCITRLKIGSNPIDNFLDYALNGINVIPCSSYSLHEFTNSVVQNSFLPPVIQRTSITTKRKTFMSKKVYRG